MYAAQRSWHFASHPFIFSIRTFPAAAGKELLYNWDGAVVGVASGDFGIAKDGSRSARYAPGVDLHAKLTLLSEGCRGSLAEQAMQRYRCGGDRD